MYCISWEIGSWCDARFDLYWPTVSFTPNATKNQHNFASRKTKKIPRTVFGSSHQCQQQRWFALIGRHDDESMNPGLFVIEHLLGPERPGSGLHVEILAGVDESRVELWSKDRRRNVPTMGGRPFAIEMVAEHHQAGERWGKRDGYTLGRLM